MTVEVQQASTSSALPDEALLCRVASAALEAVARENYAVCIRLVDADESAELNGRYRGKNRPTNVLSFEADIDPEVLPVLGDLVICADVVEGEARAQGKKLDAHYAHMVVHGVLHLAGMDHEAAQDAEAMEALEVRVLQQLGIEDPYQ